MTKDEQTWFSTKEASHYLRISPNALRILAHRGESSPTNWERD